MLSKRTKDKIVEILKRNGVKKAAVFGSFARGEEKKTGDIDILVEVPEGTVFFEFIGLEMELEKAAKRKIDLLTFNSIHPLLKDIILKEQKPIYG
ncbi:MAG: nucleotidyltransferase family protein [Minisyncoccales bacterium]